MNVVAFAARHHRGNKIARAVVAEARRIFPGRTVIRAGDVCEVMLEMMFLKLQCRSVDIECLRQSERTSRIDSLRCRILMKFRTLAGFASAY